MGGAVASRVRKRRWGRALGHVRLRGLGGRPGRLGGHHISSSGGTSAAGRRFPGAVGAPLSTVSRGCRGAGSRRARGAVLRRAVLCLINQQRALNGLNRLRMNRRLARAAKRHAADMARHNYFSHVSLAARARCGASAERAGAAASARRSPGPAACRRRRAGS